jgi:hypothetical protein
MHPRLMLALAALFLAGCGKKSEDAPVSPATQSAVEPAPGQTTASGSIASPVQPSQPDMNAVLDKLTWSVRQYCIATHRVPGSLDEVVAEGFVTKMPAAPDGEKFAIDTKKVQVVLVKE